jgi:tRNA pseudouridine13 synthase
MTDATHEVMEPPSKRIKTSSEFAPGDIMDDSMMGNGEGTQQQQTTRSHELPEENAILRKEQAVGMTAFVHPQPIALTGIFKKRYTDFLVNEILPDGRVLHLKNMKAEKVVREKTGPETTELPITDSKPATQSSAEPTPKTENQEGTNSADQASKNEIANDDKTKLVGFLGQRAVDELLDLWTSITTHPKMRPREHPTVKTDFTSDRTIRTEIHRAIRTIFHSRIDSSTNHDGILVLSAANPNFRNNHQSRVGKLSWLERGGEHLHFTLYKEMKDTQESISFLAHMLKKNARDFQMAGTKDRRAATVQRLSVWRVEAERMAALNRNQTMRNAVLGDFEHRPTGLQLGDLAGNEFVMTLRDCRLGPSGTADPDAIHAFLTASLSNLHHSGFLNYYGLQRFGTFATRSDVLGQKILKGDFEGACDAILEYNTAALDEGDDKVGRDDRARAQAIKIFRDKNDLRGALDIMPKRLSAEVAVIRTLSSKPQNFLGALMMLPRGLRQMYVHAYQSRVWNTAVTERWRLFGDKVVEGDLVLVKEHEEKEGAVQPDAVDGDGELVVHATEDDRAKSAVDAFERARPLSSGEAASGRYSIFDVVLPLPGFDVLYPSNESGDDLYKRIMAPDGMDPFDMRRGQKDFSLSGSYRKMVARIGKEFEVKVHRYRDEDEQFVLTDKEVLLGKRTDEKKQSNGDVGEQMKSDEEKTAAVLKFQLGTSQYATMALRELSGGGLEEHKPGFTGGR